MVTLKSKNTEIIIEEKGYKKKPQPKVEVQQYEYSNKNINRPNQQKRRKKSNRSQDSEFDDREKNYDLINKALEKAGVKIS